ncbi:hypothetical protein [Nocardia sp. NPDC004123]
MTTIKNPRAAAQATLDRPALWPGTDERLAGYGVMGMPFETGDYLALRHFAATSIGSGYRAVWHRNPAGEWTFYSDVAPEFSCARYFSDGGSATTVRTPIDIEWIGPYSLEVRIPGILEWRIDLEATGRTRLLSAVGRHTPAAVWRSDRCHRIMAKSVGPMLQVGHIRMSGTTPNGQHFAAGPMLMWLVSASRARLRGADLGAPAPLPQQQQLGDFWLPQRGVFVVAKAAFESFDPARHLAPAAAA